MYNNKDSDKNNEYINNKDYYNNNDYNNNKDCYNIATAILLIRINTKNHNLCMDFMIDLWFYYFYQNIWHILIYLTHFILDHASKLKHAIYYFVF